MCLIGEAKSNSVLLPSVIATVELTVTYPVKSGSLAIKLYSSFERENFFRRSIWTVHEKNDGRSGQNVPSRTNVFHIRMNHP